MGMDVYGRKPTSEKGSYFRNNVWWWRPLWDYVCEVAPELIDDDLRERGHFNDGAGLGGVKSRKLAEVLQNEIDSGSTAIYASNWQKELDALPDEPCDICGATGKRLPAPQVGPGNEECNGCKGKGTKRPLATWYPFSVENVQEFVDFLRDSGGFRIE